MQQLSQCGEQLHQLSTFHYCVRTVQPRLQDLAAANGDGAVRLWDVATRPRLQLPGHSFVVLREKVKSWVVVCVLWARSLRPILSQLRRTYAPEYTGATMRV